MVGVGFAQVAQYLVIIDPEDNTYSTVSLVKEPTCISVNDDTDYAIIGHDAFITLYNMNNNEIDNISIVVKQIQELGLTDLDILVIDDNSPDKTAARVKHLQEAYDNLHLLERPM